MHQKGIQIPIGTGNILARMSQNIQLTPKTSFYNSSLSIYTFYHYVNHF